MNAKEMKRIAADYAPFFPSDWKLIKRDFLRKKADWLQIISFNDSRFAKQYEPIASLEYLKMPGPIGGGFLACGLKHYRHNTQRWITAKQHEASLPTIYQDMVDQFQPSIVAPLDLNEIKVLLRQRTEYWPHVYALCVMAAEEGNPEDAHQWFAQFCKMMEDRPYDWAVERRKELDQVMAFMDSPDALKAHLTAIAHDKLASEKLTL